MSSHQSIQDKSEVASRITKRFKFWYDQLKSNSDYDWATQSNAIENLEVYATKTSDIKTKFQLKHIDLTDI